MPSHLVLQADVAELARLASLDLAALLAGVDDPDQAATLMLEAMPDLIAVYGAAAGTVAADWYDETRDEAQITGRFTAVVAPLPDDGRGHALAGWAAATATTAASLLTLATGGLQRAITDQSRYTVAGSSVADPKAAGWQRQGIGANCNFCNMLIGRGTVYREATAQFASHDHCNCTAVPAWDGRPLPVKAYTPSQRNIPESERERLRQWLRDHPNGF